jgi:urease accessory protein
VPETVAPDRPLRLGVAGPVGTGKSSLIALICRELAAELELAVVTNDIYTDEDARFLRAAGVLDPDRIRAVETGACPHTAIRDDVTANLLAVEDLEEEFAPLDVVLVESGGDNLTATFSPALVDAQIFVLDVAGGGDVARKGGPGIGRADLLVVNKTDLAPYVGVDVAQMVDDAVAARHGRPVLALSRNDPASVDRLSAWVRSVLAAHRSGRHVPVDPGPMAPHSHTHTHDHDHTGGDHDAGHTDHDHAGHDHDDGHDHDHDRTNDLDHPHGPSAPRPPALTPRG